MCFLQTNFRRKGKIVNSVTSTQWHCTICWCESHFIIKLNLQLLHSTQAQKGKWIVFLQKNFLRVNIERARVITSKLPNLSFVLYHLPLCTSGEDSFASGFNYWMLIAMSIQCVPLTDLLECGCQWVYFILFYSVCDPFSRLMNGS